MLSSAACARHISPVGVGRILLLSALFVTRRYDVVGPEDLKGLTADDLQVRISVFRHFPQKSQKSFFFWNSSFVAFTASGNPATCCMGPHASSSIVGAI